MEIDTDSQLQQPRIPYKATCYRLGPPDGSYLSDPSLSVEQGNENDQAPWFKVMVRQDQRQRLAACSAHVCHDHAGHIGDSI